MLPLLVVVLTVLGGILEGSEELREAVLDSAISQFPVVGERIQNDVSALTISGPWLYITIAALIWSSFGIFYNLNLTMNQVWNVDGVYRQGFVSRHLRAVLLYVMLFVAAIGTTILPDLSFLRFGSGLVSETGPLVAGSVIAAILLLGVFRLATAPVIGTRCLVPAAIVAGVFWEALQRLGTWIISDRLVNAQDLYGTIGLVVIALFWINLLARSIVLANEYAVVSQRRLYPRRIAQPPLSDADKQVLVALAHNERRRPEQTITVTFTDPEPSEPDDPDVAHDLSEGDTAAELPAGHLGAGSGASEPSASEPSASEPSASEPSASEPSASEPSASEPGVITEDRA
jgi:uncharacterized BrkB/YihY/UPF0761 family membrane protein